MVSAAVFMAPSANPSAYAFDPEKQFSEDDEPRSILRFGFMQLKKGNFEEAISAFRFGAAKNDLASQWKLARMLQTGAGLPKDDLAAYRLYAKIANRYADKNPRRVDLPYVSNAVVALGRYALKGIEGTDVRSNPRRAEAHFSRAAALYKDRDAQFELGLMYRKGLLGVKQPKSAVPWFGLSARKGHRGAQAELGEMLFYGEGVRRSPVRGLVFMSKAMANSARSGAKSIEKMRDKALKRASEAQRKAANKIIASLDLDKEDKAKQEKNPGLSNIGRIFNDISENMKERADSGQGRGKGSVKPK